MNNEWKSISDAGFQVKKMYFNEGTRPAARKTVRDLLLNIRRCFIDFSSHITIHTWMFLWHTFFFLFRINFIAHWFFIISSGLTCRKRWNDERNVCYVFRAVFRVTHVSTLARKKKKRRICECVGADKERKLNSRANVWHIFEINFSTRNKNRKPSCELLRRS